MVWGSVPKTGQVPPIVILISEEVIVGMSDPRPNTPELSCQEAVTAHCQS